MASLRKRTTDVVADSAPNDDPEVAIGVETDAPPAPEPAASSPAPELVSAQNDATEALKAQLAALRQAETMQQQAGIAMLAAQERRQAWLESTPRAKENIAALGHFHHAALNAGLADCSPSYFRFHGKTTSRTSATG